MPELPTGTVTLLFTDLEGSTRLWEEHPEAMKAALARHDEILRDAIESHDVYVVKTTAEQALGAQEFQELGARTAAMTFDDARVHVLGELDRILAELPDA